MTDLAATDQQVLERAGVLDRDIRAVCVGIRRVWIHLAADLHEFHEDRCWEVLGYDSFAAWCADPEIDLGRRRALLLIEAYRELVNDRGVQPAALEDADVSKVAVVLPAVRAGADVDEALADAKTLSRSDLKTKYTPGSEDVEWAKCQTCGSRVTRDQLVAGAE